MCCMSFVPEPPAVGSEAPERLQVGVLALRRRRPDRSEQPKRALSAVSWGSGLLFLALSEAGPPLSFRCRFG